MSGNSNGKPIRSGSGESMPPPTPFGDLYQALMKSRRQPPKSAAINEVIRQCRDANMDRKKIPAAIKEKLGLIVTQAAVRRRISRMDKQRPTITDLLSGVDAELADLLRQASEKYAQITPHVYPRFASHAEHDRSAIGAYIHRDWRVPFTDAYSIPDEEQRQRVAKLLGDRDVAGLFDECDAILIRIGYLLFTREWRYKLLSGAFRAAAHK